MLKPTLKHLTALFGALLLCALAAVAALAVHCTRLQTTLDAAQAACAAPVPESPAPLPAEPIVSQVQFDVPRGEGSATVHATVTIPQQTDAMPLVVLCHGFTGNREGNGHFAPLAQLLAEQGIASIAVDFAGCGDSEEPLTQYTLETMQTDLKAAIQYMKRQYSIREDRIGLLGHSMGGRLVSLSLDETVAAAALWSPANGDGLDGLEFLDHSDDGRQQLQAQAAAQGSVVLPQWGDVEISTEFIDQMDRSHPCRAITEYRGSLLIAFAAADTALLSQQTIDNTLQAALDRNLNFVNLYGQFSDATHNFTALSGDPDTDAAVCSRIEQQTAGFFAQALLD